MTEHLDGSPDIPFDYDAALAAARALTGLAESTRTTATNRQTFATAAADRWQGDLLTEFVGRVDDEVSAMETAATELDAGATKWAVVWRDVMFENNKRRRGRAVKRISDERSGASKAWDNYGFGSDDSDDKVAEARCPALPTPPGFVATDTPQVFAS